MKVRFLVYSLLLFTACHKDTKPSATNPVPSVYVDLTIYPNDPHYFNVQAIGGWMYITGGIRGIILYRKSNEEFVAIERTSSQLPDNDHALGVVQKDNFTILDSVSGSKWRLIDAVVMQGPAKWPLRMYGTTYDGSVLRIRN